MAVFQLDFPPALTDIAVPNAQIRESRTVPDENTMLQAQQASRALDAIQSQLAQFARDLQSHQQAVENRVTDLAIQVMQSLVCENEIVRSETVRKFAEIACHELRPQTPQRITVHPDCLATINEWIKETNAAIDLVSDPRVLPGNCVVEIGDQGVAANLEDYVQASIEDPSTQGTVGNDRD